MINFSPSSFTKERRKKEAAAEKALAALSVKKKNNAIVPTLGSTIVSSVAQPTPSLTPTTAQQLDDFSYPSSVPTTSPTKGSYNQHPPPTTQEVISNNTGYDIASPMSFGRAQPSAPPPPPGYSSPPSYEDIADQTQNYITNNAPSSTPYIPVINRSSKPQAQQPQVRPSTAPPLIPSINRDTKPLDALSRQGTTFLIFNLRKIFCLARCEFFW